MHEKDNILNFKAAAFVRHLLIGGAMGVANVIPGVSGGTIAVVFGIYEYMMEAIGNVFTDKNRRWEYVRFLSVIFGGAILAILGFANIIKWAYANHELMTVFFFMGLIAGSIPIIVKSNEDMKPTPLRCFFFMVGLAFVIGLALMDSGDKAAGATSQIDWANFGLVNYLYFFLAGVVASSAMIIPGISGSFILILMGVYWLVIESVSSLTTTFFEQGFTAEIVSKAVLLGTMGVGVAVGIIGFSKIITYAFRHFPSITLYVILGLIVGSFYQIYPGFEWSVSGGGAIITFAIGLFISLRFSRE